MRVGRFMSHPASPLTLVDVPACARGDRHLEWRCRVRERNRYTDDMVELTVLATCDERTCTLERNP
jgi:hypothetical protein